MDASFLADTDSLLADVKENRRRLDKADSQLDRRNYVRSVFACYEGELVNLRERVAQMLVDEFMQTGKWNLYQLVPLFDEQAQASDKGKLLDNCPNRVPFNNLVAFTFRTMAELLGLPVDFLQGNGWASFKQAVAVRHRITHPKRGENVDVSDEDLAVVELSRQWWRNTGRKLMEAYKPDWLSRRTSGLIPLATHDGPESGNRQNAPSDA